VIGGGLRARITLAAMVAAVLPVALFGLLLVANGSTGILPLVLTALVVAALVGLAVGGFLVGAVTAPLRALGARLDRITAGERPDPLPPLADDELGRLAERQEDLAAGFARRNRQVERAVAAITAWAPGDGAARLLEHAARDAREGLGLTDARIVLGDPDDLEYEERVPGEPQPVRADLRTGREVAGVLVGHAPATTRWEPADQDLLELFAASHAVALRDADVLTGHPLLEHVDLSGVAIRRLVPWRADGTPPHERLVSLGGDAIILVEKPAPTGTAPAGPARVYVAFDLAAENTNFGMTESFVFFLANALDYLAPQARAASVYEYVAPLQADFGPSRAPARPGSPRSGSSEDRSRTGTVPRWEPVAIWAPPGGADADAPLPWPGLYRDPSGQLHAVNLLALDSAQPDTEPRQRVAALSLPAPVPLAAGVELWPALALAAAALWLAGWTLRTR
jgi:hypothetical protein